jgi:hypothetical protein
VTAVYRQGAASLRPRLVAFGTEAECRKWVADMLRNYRADGCRCEARAVDYAVLNPQGGAVMFTFSIEGSDDR